MKYLPLIWAGLWRKGTRTVFTLLSVVVAFLLFGMLQGVNAGFSEVVTRSKLDRLLTDPRVPGGAPIPVSAAARIEELPEVTRVASRAMFFGFFQNPKNGMAALATDPEDWFAVRPEFEMPKAQLDLLLKTRTGIVVSQAMQSRFGWKVGDKIPLQSPIRRTDGSNLWTFDLVGVMDNRDSPNQAVIALINYSYFDEARADNRGTADRFIVRIKDPNRSAATAAAIDKLFENSSHETRTQNEQEQTESQLKQVGDISFFINSIVAAVFFTLLFLTGNTMMHSVRERIPEFAVLKTMGFSGTSVLLLVLAESMLLCVLAAGIGLALSAAAFPYVRDTIGLARLSPTVVAAGMGAAVLLAFISALMPARRVQRMRIVDALRS